MDIETFNKAKNLQTIITTLKQEWGKVSAMRERDGDHEFNELRSIAALTIDQLMGHAEREFNEL